MASIRKIHDTIQCGDAGQLLRHLPDDCADLVITSPPYFKQRSYNGHGFGIGREKHPELYLEALLETFEECVRAVKPTGSIVYNLGDKYLEASLALIPYRFALLACDRFNVKLVNEVTWVKRNPMPRQYDRRLVPSTEPFFHFALSGDYYYDRSSFCRSYGESRPRAGANVGKRYFELIQESDKLTAFQKKVAEKELRKVIAETHNGTIAGFRMKIAGIHAEAFGGEGGGRKGQMDRDGFTIIRIKGEKIKRDIIETPVETIQGIRHTAVFPLSIIREFIKLLTPIGGLVIDPYVGSGTSAVAAVAEGRHYVGIDIDPSYCELAKDRIEKEKQGRVVHVAQ